MKPTFQSTLAALLLCSAALPCAAASFRPGELLVISSSTDRLELRSGGMLSSERADAAAILSRHGLTRWAPLGPERDSGAPMFFKAISDQPRFDPVLAARELVAAGAFRAAIPNYTLRLFLTLPNDPYRAPRQWFIHDPAGDADIDLPEAWDITHGDSAIVIGIADTGVDLGHPDLAAQIFTNRLEVPGNGLDDDGNGYVDDVHGWDFGDGDADPNPEPFIDPQYGVDVGFHGTFAAGIAAAATDNAQGIAGAGWNCRILPLRVSDVNSEITSDALAEAFLYAAAMRVDVLNLSLGSAAEPGLPEFFQALVDSFLASGGVCVAAAGNDGTNAQTYPAACAGVIAVGATNDLDDRASFSNFGPWVDVAAPGEAMWSAICRNYEIDEFSLLFYEVFFEWDAVNPYMRGDGTSFAAPLAAGTSALVRAVRPALDGLGMEQYLVATGDPVSYDQPIGKKVNAHSAVGTPAAVAKPGSPARVRLAQPTPLPVRSHTTIAFSLSAAAEVTVRILDPLGRRVRTLVRGALPAGTHRASWDRRADDGSVVESGIYHLDLQASGQRAGMKLVVLR